MNAFLLLGLLFSTPIYSTTATVKDITILLNNLKQQTQLEAPQQQTCKHLHTLQIPQLTNCSSQDSTTVSYDPRKKTIILIHGINSAENEFEKFSMALEQHNYQAYCFRYDDRQNLMTSANQLANSIQQLSQQTKVKKITILAHSLGAIMSRKAFIKENPKSFNSPQTTITYISVAGPYNGIDAAKTCGDKTTAFISLGISSLICRLISGQKWLQITPQSDFIRHPGTLNTNIDKHIKIVTQEVGQCRTYQHNKCLQSDTVFTLAEQHNKVIDRSKKTDEVIITAGHANVIKQAPDYTKIIDIIINKQ